MTEMEMVKRIHALEAKLREIPDMMEGTATIPTEIANEWQALDEELGHPLIFSSLVGMFIPIIDLYGGVTY